MLPAWPAFRLPVWCFGSLAQVSLWWLPTILGAATLAHVSANVDNALQALSAPLQKDTAVCASGQLRHFGKLLPANISDWPQDIRHVLTRLPFGERKSFLNLLRRKEGLRIVDTVHMFLYPNLGAVDLYMSVSLTGSQTHEDIAEACNMYRPKYRTSVGFCSSHEDQQWPPEELGLKWFEYRILQGSSLVPWERYLGQLQGQSACNGMIRHYEQNLNVRYTWIVRLRLDVVFFAPFHAFTKTPPNPNIVYTWTPGRDMFLDAFNVGPRDIMHAFLNRMDDFGQIVNSTRGPSPMWALLYPWFNAEDYLKLWVKYYYLGEVWKLDDVHLFPFRFPSERARVPGEAEGSVPWQPASVEPSATEKWQAGY